MKMKNRRKKNNTKEKLILLLIVTAAILLIAALAPYLVPYDPYEQDLTAALQAPGNGHLLGTDRYGRDLFSRVLMGGRTTIYAALLLTGIVTVIGTGFGLVCGLKGGRTDTILMRISDLFLAFPGIVFAIAVAGVLGGGIGNAIIALSCISWPKYARIARSQVLMIKEQPYIEAAKMAGTGMWKMIGRHILPNIAGPIVVTAVLDIGTMMMEIAGLSYLGLGAKMPTAEWGSMMSTGRTMMQTAPWTILAPGLGIFITVVIFHLLGDAVRDFLDPKQRNR